MLMALSFKVLITTRADDTEIALSLFFRENKLDVSCESSA